MGASLFSLFSLTSAHLLTCDGRTHTVHVGDVVHLLDDNQYRVLKIISSTGPIVLKRTNHSSYRSFLRSPDQLVISNPQTDTRSIQTEQLPTGTTDPLEQSIWLCCGSAAVTAYHLGAPTCLGSIHFDPPLVLSSCLWDTNLQRGRHYDKVK